jgi:hypothetical protein
MTSLDAEQRPGVCGVLTPSPQLSSAVVAACKGAVTAIKAHQEDELRPFAFTRA